uniref:Putative secreted protein n=1 Tax=Anopheles darlingi TaxID=43151 RepID=A0A2M4D2J9_ANODA
MAMATTTMAPMLILLIRLNTHLSSGRKLRSIHTPSGCTNLSFHFGNYLTPAPSLRVGRFSTDRPLQADCCRPSF